MTFAKWTAFILLCMISERASAEPNVERFAGVARSPKGEVVYRERHEVTENGGRPLRAVTRYFDPKGREIGRLETDFTRSVAAPSYRFVDERTGKSESASVSGSSVVLDHAGRRKALEAKGPEPLVVGQGLHHYVRQNLERLAHETVTVRFAVPSRLDTYVFRIRPLSSGSPGVVRLRIESDNWLVRQLAPYLEVDYELKTRHLLRYRGVSNLETPDGSSQDVEIRYAYGDAT